MNADLNCHPGNMEKKTHRLQCVSELLSCICIFSGLWRHAGQNASVKTLQVGVSELVDTPRTSNSQAQWPFPSKKLDLVVTSSTEHCLTIRGAFIYRHPL